VKRQVRQRSSATGLCSLAFDACLFHDRVETPTQADAFPPCLWLPVQGTLAGIANACALQKLMFKLRMQRKCHRFSRFAHRKSNDLLLPINRASAHVRHVIKPRSSVAQFDSHPAFPSRSGFVDNRVLASGAGSIDSLSPDSSPLQSSSTSLDSRRLDSRPASKTKLGDQWARCLRTPLFSDDVTRRSLPFCFPRGNDKVILKACI